MILLEKFPLDMSLYRFNASDTPSVGSETDLYINVKEMANVLDPFDIVYDRVLPKIKNYNLLLDKDIATNILGDYYNNIRHGLAFDWTMNYVIKLIADVLPLGIHYRVFKGTQPFIDMFKDDQVFQDEIQRLHDDTTILFNGIFGDNPHDCLITNIIKDPDIIKKSDYLTLLIEMLQDSIGYMYKGHWSEQFTKMFNDHPYTTNHLIVTGCSDRAFCYGDLDGTGIKWHLLSNGIQNGGSFRTQRSGYIRAFPDEQTFVRIENDTMWLDETYFPMISINNGPFVSALEFNGGIECQLEKPYTLTLNYKFKQDINNPKQIKLTAGQNCIIRDPIVTLDETGSATTQIIFRGSSVTFKITDPDKHYPFSFFTTSKITGDLDGAFAWLT